MDKSLCETILAEIKLSPKSVPELAHALHKRKHAIAVVVRELERSNTIRANVKNEDLDGFYRWEVSNG